MWDVAGSETRERVAIELTLLSGLCSSCWELCTILLCSACEWGRKIVLLSPYHRQSSPAGIDQNAYCYDSDLIPSFKRQPSFWLSWTHGLAAYEVQHVMNTIYKYSLSVSQFSFRMCTALLRSHLSLPAPWVYLTFFLRSCFPVSSFTYLLSFAYCLCWQPQHMSEWFCSVTSQNHDR